MTDDEVWLVDHVPPRHLAVAVTALLTALVLLAPPDLATLLLLVVIVPVVPAAVVAKAAHLRGGQFLLSLGATWALAFAGSFVASRIGLVWPVGYGLGLAIGPLLAVGAADDGSPRAGTGSPGTGGVHAHLP